MRLEIGEVYTKVVNASKDIVLAIDDECSYLQENWEFAKDQMIKKALENGSDNRLQYANDWDGRIRLMSGISFPSGLLPRVLQRLELEGVTVMDIVDVRKRPMRVDSSLRMTAKFERRDYQADAIESAFNKTRGVIKAPTGAGKTVIGTALIARAHVPTLIIVNKKVLMTQWRDAILDFIDLPSEKRKPRDGYVGIVQGQIYEPSIFTIVMAQTLQSWLKRDVQKFRDLMRVQPNGWQMLIEDECHGLGAMGRYQLNLRIPSFYRYGFSATPFDRSDANLRVEAALGPSVYEIQPTKLIDTGHIAKPTIKFHPVERLHFGDFVKYIEVYREGIVHNLERNKKVIDIAIASALKGKKVLVFVNFIKHGEILEALLTEKEVMHVDDEPGAEGAFVHGTHPNREIYLQRFKEKGEWLDILIAIDKLIGEGFDYKGIDVIVIADGGKSSIETIQKVGRGTRVLPDKKTVEIHDFADRCKYLYDHARARIATWRNPELGYEVDLNLVPYFDV